jgi:hypothetical protein
MDNGGMSDESIERPQPKATTKEGMAIETLAVKTLKNIIAKSKFENLEYGGVIHRDNKTGKIEKTGPFPGDRDNHVDIAQGKPNWGCPENTTPVAWYHTHPMKERVTVTPKGVIVRMAMEWDKFIEGDKVISDGNNMIGYMIDPDGQLWRYNPPPGFMLNGKWTTRAEDKGVWGKLPING